LRLVGVARTHPRRRARRWLAWLGACLVLATVAAAPAHAATLTINGNPLTITADDTGVMQVAFTGSASGEFLAQPNAPAYAGLTAALRTTGNASVFSYTTGGGFRFTPTAGQPLTLTGDGSAGNPFILTAQFDAVPGPPGQTPALAHVVQQIVYFNGSTDVAVNYALSTTVSAAALQGRLFASADLAVAGNDSGIGFFNASPLRQVGGAHPLGNGAASLVEVSPWSAYQEDAFSTIQNIVNSTSAAPPSFANTVNPGLVDAAVGVQWNFSGFGPSTPFGESVIWRFTRTSPLVLAAATPTQAVGQTATVTVTARNPDGGPDAGRAVRYSIAGANPGSGAVTTAADGTAAISWTGTRTGTDTLTAFVDRDGNGLRDVNTEPQQTAVVTWTPALPPPPPVPGKSVVVKVVSGQVFIKRPASGRARQATGPAKGFVPFTGAANIPVGSQLDTRKGRVALTSAADTGAKKTQTSDFYQGIFQVKQALPKKTPKKPTALTTDLVMKGQIARSQCAPLKGARAAAESAKKKKGPKAVLGKLWGNGKGKFRTNGKYSAATVRGTVWLVEDRCEGTFTKVTRGTVQVRDFRRKKTVTVKAGHSYLARAQRAASKAKRR
jgi:hypothetical protein